MKFFTFIFAIAVSNSAVAPELAVLAQARKSSEYKILRRLQNLTLDLQMLEITLKNRRDPQLEEKISTIVSKIEQQGETVGKKFRDLRSRQLEGLDMLLEFAADRGAHLGVSPAEWRELREALATNQITAGTLSVHGTKGALDLITLSPLTMGKNSVWAVTAPAPKDRRNFWRRAHIKVEKCLEPINAPYAEAETLAKNYFVSGYAKLYSAFESHRYAILQRISAARRELTVLGSNNTAMGTPEEYSTLYNQVLENLYSYGVDVSATTFKGFLFAEDPAHARELVDRLKFSPSLGTYNSPES